MTIGIRAERRKKLSAACQLSSVRKNWGDMAGHDRQVGARRAQPAGIALDQRTRSSYGRCRAMLSGPSSGKDRVKFEYEDMERETGFEPATSTLARLRSTE